MYQRAYRRKINCRKAYDDIHKNSTEIVYKTKRKTNQIRDKTIYASEVERPNCHSCER